MSGAWLSARAARIAIDDTLAFGPFDLQVERPWLLLVGQHGPLTALLTGHPQSPDLDRRERGLARVAGGEVRVLGRDVAKRAHHEAVGMAPLDPPLPGDWDVRQHLAWSAHLRGAGRRQAAALADGILHELGLEAHAGRRIAGLALHERRTLVLASAALGDPEAVVVEAPWFGLSDKPVALVCQVLERVAADKKLILTLPRLDLDGPEQAWLGDAHVAVLRDGTVTLSAPTGEALAEAPLFEVEVMDGGEALAEALAARGYTLTGGPRHYAVRGERGAVARDVLAAAHASGAVVTSCAPLI